MKDVDKFSTDEKKNVQILPIHKLRYVFSELMCESNF